jgi:hypothetical protein
MIPNRRTLSLAMALTVLCFGAPPIWAATLTWNNTGGGNWNVAGNWTPNGVPGAADTAVITAPGTYVVSVNDAESAASITIGATPGALALEIGSGGVLNVSGVSEGATAQGVYGATAFSLLFGSSGTSGASPVLTIGRVGGTLVDISWPTAAGNFTLQSSPDLTPGSWSSIVSGITTVGPNYVLPIGVGGNAAFYRLESQ